MARLDCTMLQQLLACQAKCWLHSAPSSSSRLSQPAWPLAWLHGRMRHSLPDLQSSTVSNSLYMDTALVLQADIPVVIGGRFAWLHLLSDVLWQDASWNSTMIEVLEKAGDFGPFTDSEVWSGAQRQFAAGSRTVQGPGGTACCNLLDWSQPATLSEARPADPCCLLRTSPPCVGLSRNMAAQTGLHSKAAPTSGFCAMSYCGRRAFPLHLQPVHP